MRTLSFLIDLRLFLISFWINLEKTIISIIIHSSHYILRIWHASILLMFVLFRLVKYIYNLWIRDDFKLPFYFFSEKVIQFLYPSIEKFVSSPLQRNLSFIFLTSSYYTSTINNLFLCYFFLQWLKNYFQIYINHNYKEA